MFRRFSDNDKNSQNSRIYTLLKQYGLQDNLVDTKKSPEKAIKILNKDVTSLISNNSSASQKWLIASIQGE